MSAHRTVARRWVTVAVAGSMAVAALGTALAGSAQAACLAPANGICPPARQVPLAITDAISNTVIVGEFLVPTGPPPGNPNGAGTNGCGNNSGQNQCVAVPFVPPTPTPTPTPSPDGSATPPEPPPAPPVANPCAITIEGKLFCEGGTGGEGGKGKPIVPEPKPGSEAPIPVGQPTSPVVQPPPAIADQVEPIQVPPAASKEEAPVVGVQLGEVAVVQIVDLPKRMPWTSQMSVGKNWYQIGRWKKTSYQGSATYPAFTAYKPGWYWLKAENKQGKCWWVKVRAYAK